MVRPTRFHYLSISNPQNDPKWSKLQNNRKAIVSGHIILAEMYADLRKYGIEYLTE